MTEGMKMARRSPGEVLIMLHYHTRCERWQPVTDWSAGVEAKLVGEGLLEYVDGIPTSTPLGVSFVECICSTPIPVTAFVDPRTNEHIEVSL